MKSPGIPHYQNANLRKEQRNLEHSGYLNSPQKNVKNEKLSQSASPGSAAT